MFSYFYSPKPIKTRFENTKEFEDLIPILSKLEKQCNSLHAIADGNTASIAYSKNRILRNVITQLNKTIQEFNILPCSDNIEIEVVVMRKLVKEMLKIVSNTIEHHQFVLNQHRSEKREVTKSVVKTAAMISSAGAGVATGSVICTGLSIFVVGPAINESINRITGLSDNRTKTVCIMEELVNKLAHISSLFDWAIYDFSQDPHDDIQPLVCIITKEKIKNPVLCLLDGRMYEKEALVTWLTEHRTSPFNRKKMLDDQIVSDVIIENRSLKEALDELENFQIKQRGQVSSESKEPHDEKAEPKEESTIKKSIL